MAREAWWVAVHVVLGVEYNLVTKSPPMASGYWCEQHSSRPWSTTHEDEPDTTQQEGELLPNNNWVCISILLLL